MCVKHHKQGFFLILFFLAVMLLILFANTKQGLLGSAIETKRCHDADLTDLSADDPSYGMEGHVLVLSGTKPVQSFVDSCKGRTLTEYYCKGNTKHQMKIDCKKPCTGRGRC